MGYWIVVVDDEVISLTNARNLLNEQNMKVSCLKSGQDLLKFVEKNTPDLILLDILMPEMDGFETFKALRDYENEADKEHIPVIFLTGENDTETEKRGLELGASDFIRKPFAKDILLSRIDKTIRYSKTISDLTEEATVDKLTGFLNKASGTEKVAELCKEETGMLVVMDLDSFKLVNDLFGHDMGDRVLMAVAEIMRRNTRESDVLARIGGDEFMAFLPNETGEAAISALSGRLNGHLMEEAARLMGADNGVPLGISIGAIKVPDYGRDLGMLFALADECLYTVKQNGKHGFRIYDDAEEECRSELDPAQEIERTITIVEERNEAGGAQFLGTEAFTVAYRSLVRYLKKNGGKSSEVMFILRQIKKPEGERFSDVCGRFWHVLQDNLDRSDLIMQLGANRYFVFLPGRDEEESTALIDHITDLWKEADPDGVIKPEYTVKSEVYS